MRPKSKNTLQVEAALNAGGACLRDVVQATRLPEPAVRAVLCNLVRAGQAAYERRLVPWSLRPVAFYRPSCRAAAQTAGQQVPLAGFEWHHQLGQALRAAA